MFRSNSMRSLAFVALILAFGICCANTQDQAKQSKDKHVIVVSIDGCRPDFYLSKDFETPILKKLATEGSHAKGVTGVFPSVTYPSHSTIATGVFPDKHMVLSNTLSEEIHGDEREKLRKMLGMPKKDSIWYWKADYLKAKPIWEIVRENGMTSAVVYWPVSIGAKCDYLIPEVFTSKPDLTFKLLLEHCSKKVINGKEIPIIAEISEALGKQGINLDPAKMDGEEHPDKVDEFITAAACYIISTYKPNLTMIHLIQADMAQHATGTQSERTRAAVKNLDALIGKIWRTVEDAGLKSTTTLIVTGDHGFMDCTKRLNLKTELKPIADKVVLMKTGAFYGVYLKKGVDGDEIMRFLKDLQKKKPLFEIIPKDEMKKLRSNPDCFCGISAGENVALDSDKKGDHGYLPSMKQMKTGFIIYGAAAAPGQSVDNVNLVDIAPTVCKILGIKFSGFDGVSVDKLLKND